MATQGVEIKAATKPEYDAILTPEALEFIGKLGRKFGSTRTALLKKRVEVQEQIDSGKMPDFLASTKKVRSDTWKVADAPHDLVKRQVEITGPVDRKMVINALNSGADVFMADFEDSHSPTWDGTIQGQINMRDAVRREISFKSPEGKTYALNKEIATLIVRPRGWHLVEKHALVDGQPMSASLFDFGLYFFHNARELLKRGTGPYFYLPKMESHLEARLWNEVFCFAQDELKIPRGTIRATVLIETILAAFEMDEILYELREHSSGLNCGRWDYIFSFIKKFRNKPEFVMPDRAQVTMNEHFLKSYCELLVQTCHRRGAYAMGGMAAQIPIKNDPEANAVAMDKVVKDKQREVRLGHDGTWVAHPGLVPVARQAFIEGGMKGDNQLHVARDDVRVTAADLLKVPKGEITEAGLRMNIRVGVQYLEAWLRGSGCVPLYNLMEDAATAEISRAQVWQWIKHGHVSVESFRKTLKEELAKLPSVPGSKMELAAKLFDKISTDTTFSEFLTLSAYEYLN